MAFLYHLYTTATIWCSLDALATAINAQAGLQAQVTGQGNDVRVHCVQKGRMSSATLGAFDQGAYDRLLARPQAQVNQAERDAMPQLQRTVVLTTEQADADGALCQVAIADAIWWLLGGFLGDPRTGTLWGRKAWRELHSLREHAAALLAAPESTLTTLPPPRPLPPLTNGERPTSGVTIYTLPYCRYCRELTQLLVEQGVPFEEIDVVRTPGAAATMLRLNQGQRAAPTIRIGSQVLVGPEPDELAAALRAAGLIRVMSNE